jgi:hypothetical protein
MKSAAPAGDRAAQVSGAAERGRDQHEALRQVLPQLLSRLETRHPGHLDVERGHVWQGAHRRGNHLVTAGGLGHDLDVRLELEQADQGAAEQCLS